MKHLFTLCIFLCCIASSTISGVGTPSSEKGTASPTETRIEIKKIQGCTGSSIKSAKILDNCNSGMCLEIKATADGMHGNEDWHFDWGNGKAWDTSTHYSSNPNLFVATFNLCGIYTTFGTYTLSMAVTPAHSTCLSSWVVTYTTTPTMSVNSATICSGSSTVLTANSGAKRFTWSTGDTTASITVSPSTTTTYTVNGDYTAGCTKSASAVVTVNQKPLAGFSMDKDTIFPGECINVNDLSLPNAGTITSRKWYYDNTLISGNPGFQYCPSSTSGDHKICLAVVNTDGCKDSICKNLYVRLATAIGKEHKVQQGKSFLLTGQNNYSIEIESKKQGIAFIEIVDMTGKQVLSGNVASGKNKVDISLMASGFYVVRVYSGEDQQFFKLMKK